VPSTSACAYTGLAGFLCSTCCVSAWDWELSDRLLLVAGDEDGGGMFFLAVAALRGQSPARTISVLR
jgi:hypothetical protein